ncbi:DUF3592 domain-containing protein [Streptomyces tibetensis]|uniref:DUF3592 domain-containing protein n=1 Tax=Streptomyces tibetensis TaxID=2382123 RepID=UPI0033D4F660
MSNKKRKRRPADQYQLPPKVEHARQAAARMATFQPRLPIPRLRVIWGCTGLGALCVGMALFFWLPSRSLVEDLRSSGVTAAATVIDVDTKPKYVKIRISQGPKAGTAVKLSEIAGMLPDARAGDSMLVTYDPKDPSRSLARSWVMAPPVNLPAYGSSAFAVFFLLGAAAVSFRRRRILRTWPPNASLADSTQPVKPGSKSVRLTKP